ncbi:MAG: AMP-binding protein, partial [Alphaproteobacteria bacterium]|nr:AMP-binding protein [Alphaproteobacteria bacterium]
MHPIVHAQTRPDHPAIIMAGSGETVTYGEMDATANRFANLLRKRGLGRGDHFGMLMENNALFLQLVWGSQRSGAMMVPVSTRLTAPEIAYILQDSDARLMVTSTKFADVIEELREHCPQCEFLILGGDGDEDLETAIAAQSGEPLADPLPGQYMLYSSGTTGRPKGVRPRPPETGDIQEMSPL